MPCMRVVWRRRTQGAAVLLGDKSVHFTDSVTLITSCGNSAATLAKA